MQLTVILIKKLINCGRIFFHFVHFSYHTFSHLRFFSVSREVFNYEFQPLNKFLKIFQFLNLKNSQFFHLRRPVSPVLFQLRRESGQTGQLGALVSEAKKPEAVLVF